MIERRYLTRMKHTNHPTQTQGKKDPKKQMWAYDRPLSKAEYLADFLLENGGRIVEETLKHLTRQSCQCISESTHFRAEKWFGSLPILNMVFWRPVNRLILRAAVGKLWALSKKDPVFKGNSDYIGTHLSSLTSWSYEYQLIREGAYWHEILYLLSQHCRKPSRLYKRKTVCVRICC